MISKLRDIFFFVIIFYCVLISILCLKANADIEINAVNSEHPEIRLLSSAVFDYLSGAIQENLGGTQGAIETYSRMLDYTDNASYIHVKIASDYIVLEDFEKAFFHLAKALEEEPANYRARLLLAYIYRKLGEFGKAKEEYEKALEYNPENTTIMAFLSDFFISENDLENAAKTYEKMLNIRKHDAFLYLNLAIIYSRLDRLDDAEENLKKSLKIDREYLDARVLLGFVYELEGDFDAALMMYEKALELYPMNAEILTRLGSLLYRTGDDEGAVKEFREVISFDPENAEPYLKISGIFMLKEETAKAKSVLLEAIANGADGSPVFAALGYMAFKSGDYREAYDYYKHALGKEPDKNIYRFYLAVSESQIGKEQEAIQDLEECIRGNADIPEAYNFLGHLYAKNGINTERAIALIGKALEFDPDNGAYYDSLALAYLAAGKPEKAYEYIAKAKKFLPDDPDIREHLGDIYFSMGKFDDAIQEWKNIDVPGGVRKRITKKIDEASAELKEVKQ